LAVFHADPNLRLTAADLGPMVGEDLHATLRALLRRMVNEGLLMRVRRGLYALRR
jgi:predicted transcriptional regulator of viral defense system